MSDEKQKTEIPVLDVDGLKKADAGSWYWIAGCGGDLQDWVDGYQEILTDRGAGTPTGWFQVSGDTVNRYVERKKGGTLVRHDAFAPDLVGLLFPLDGLNIGVLAMVKMGMGDRWFDDVVANMRVAVVVSD